jgi:hypothetical protein
LYASQNIIRVIKSRMRRWVEHTAYIAGMINAYTITVMKPQGKGLLGRAKCKWEDNIMTDFNKTGCGGLECI